jgi:hypothetical protein
MPVPLLRLRSPVGNGLRNDPDDVHGLAVSLENAGGPATSDAARIGIWDQATRDGVIDFQKRRGLKVDGALLPDGETEQNINEIIVSQSSGSGTTASPPPSGRAPARRKLATAVGTNRQRSTTDRTTGAVTRPSQPLGSLARFPASTSKHSDSRFRAVPAGDRNRHEPISTVEPPVRYATQARRSGVAPFPPASSRTTHLPDDSGIILAAEHPRNRSRSSKRDTPSDLVTAPPIVLVPAPRWLKRAISHVGRSLDEPIPELVEIKRQTLRNIDAALAEFSKRGNRSLLSRFSNGIAASQLRQARAYTDAFMPTTKADLATFGISVVGSIAAVGKTLIVLKRGNKVFLESRLAQELKLLSYKKPPTHQHHPLPQFGKSEDNEIFRNFFADRGINIHQIVVHVPADMHLKWLHGGGDRWLNDWKVWIKNNPDATASQVYRFAGEMNYKYGLDGMEFGPYRRARTRKHIQK